MLEILMCITPLLSLPSPLFSPISAGTSSFTIVGSSTEQPIELIPGSPSAPMVLAGGSVAHYSVEIADTANDLIGEWILLIVQDVCSDTVDNLLDLS